MPRTKNRNAKAHLRSGRWIIEQRRYAIYFRDGMRCAYCERDVAQKIGTAGVVLDHVRSGDDNSNGNLVTCCADCNNRKGGRALEEWANPETVRRVLAQAFAPVDEEAGRQLYEARGAIGMERYASEPVSASDIAELLATIQ